MTISSIKTTLPYEVRRVWDVVTDVERYSWRSDLSRTERLNETQFTEYAQNGFPTTFTVTAAEPYKRWEFDLENSSLAGHWTGVYTQKGQETEITFTESVTVKKFFMKPFVKSYLKRQQALFVSDLKKALARPEP